MIIMNLYDDQRLPRLIIDVLEDTETDPVSCTQTECKSLIYSINNIGAL